MSHITKLLAISLIVMSGVVSAEQGDILIRVRGIAVIPNDDSGTISLFTGPVGTPLAGSGVSVDSSIVPEVDITYMLHRNWGIEVIAGMTNHDVKLEGPGAALTGLGFTDNYKIFDAWVLPPTVTLQYHFMPENHIRPYAGIGINYTAFLWNDATDSLEAAVGSPVDVDTDSSWGWAAQVGVDIDWKNNWYFNLDLKYIDIDTTASLLIKNGALGGTGLRVDANIDPFVVGAGIGYRF